MSFQLSFERSFYKKNFLSIIILIYQNFQMTMSIKLLSMIHHQFPFPNFTFTVIYHITIVAFISLIDSREKKMNHQRHAHLHIHQALIHLLLEEKLSDVLFSVELFSTLHVQHENYSMFIRFSSSQKREQKHHCSIIARQATWRKKFPPVGIARSRKKH